MSNSLTLSSGSRADFISEGPDVRVALREGLGGVLNALHGVTDALSIRKVLRPALLAALLLSASAKDAQANIWGDLLAVPFQGIGMAAEVVEDVIVPAAAKTVGFVGHQVVGAGESVVVGVGAAGVGFAVDGVRAGVEHVIEEAGSPHDAVEYVPAHVD